MRQEGTVDEHPDFFNKSHFLDMMMFWFVCFFFFFCPDIFNEQTFSLVYIEEEIISWFEKNAAVSFRNISEEFTQYQFRELNSSVDS